MTTAPEIFAETAAALRARPWCEQALRDWPAPIANELHQLLNMLDSGQDAGGLLMQTRDLAEVLLKTLTLACAADLASRPGTPGADQANALVVDRMKSLGAWLEAFRSLAAALPDESILAAELRKLGKGPFVNAMGDYVANRNRDIGHGAYRPDSIAVAKGVRGHLLGGEDGRRGLIHAFEELSSSGLWAACQVRLDAPDGPSFSGHKATGALRSGGQGHDHQVRALHLVRGEAALSLSPFIAGRRCTECAEQDAFLFEGPTSMSASDGRVDLIDYANGHRLRMARGQQDEALRALIGERQLSRALSESGERSEFTGAGVVRLLDDILFDRRFISPEWLREPLREAIRADQRGLWVRAPGHVGKTMFVRGLTGEGLAADERDRQQDILGDGTRFWILPVFLKREYRFDLTQFRMNIENVARRNLRDDSRLALRLPGAETTSFQDVDGELRTRRRDYADLSEAEQIAWRDELQTAFADFAATCAEAAFGEEVIIAVDGLDELPDPAGGLSVVDMLPDADRMPQGTRLLLTSRPLPDCPVWLRDRAAARPGLSQVFAAGVETPSYVALLRDYIGRHCGVPPKSPDFERAAAAILTRAEGLFLFVSFICDQMREAIAPADAA